jgi:Ca2+-binding RTX toxin-like protein
LPVHGQYLSDTRVELGDLDDRLRTLAAPDESDGIDEFAVYGGPGNDRLTANQGGSAGLAGGEGDDQLRVRGDVLEAWLDGGPGDDEMWAGRTTSELLGGGGRDVMHGGESMRDGDREGAGGDAGPGPDVFDATASPQVIVSYSERHAPVRINLRRGVGGQAGEGDTSIGVRNVVGGAGDDRIRGGSGAEVLRGGSGYDRLSGGGGDDELWPGRGGSRLTCGPGVDEIWATSSKDWLAMNCELIANTPARPTGLRYPVQCAQPTDAEGEPSGHRQCSVWIHVWQVGAESDCSPRAPFRSAIGTNARSRSR